LIAAFADFHSRGNRLEGGVQPKLKLARPEV
jgi:hypothetical protein